MTDISLVADATPTTVTVTLPPDINVSVESNAGPVGPQGVPGDPNELSIGTVEAGLYASATITGTPPIQTLDLVLPVGQTLLYGEVAPTTEGVDGDFYIDTVTYYIYGPKNGTWPAGVSITGPQGDTGATGPANSLSIGTVTTGTAGATITGTAPTQTLDLVLPTTVDGTITPTKESGGYTAKTATYTVDPDDRWIECTSGTFTVNLHTAVGYAGRSHLIKNSGTGVITVDPNGSQTIDGQLTILLTQYDAVTVVSNGANWMIA